MMQNNLENHLDKSNDILLEKLQQGLQTIQMAHRSNEVMVSRLLHTAQSEQQQHMCNNLQKDMGLINDQLDVLLNRLNRFESGE